MLFLLLLFLVYAIALSIGLALAGHRSQMAALRGAPSHHPSRVLIIGATGGTGRQLVSQALLDQGSVDVAMCGQEAVLSALGHKRFFYPTRILSEGTRNILRAMETHSVPRLVCAISLGIGDSAGRMGLYYTLFVIPVILPFYFWDKTRQERLIARTNLEWVIVRPGALTNGEKRGRYRHGRHVGSFLLTVRISRADVADFILNQLESDTYLRTAAGVCW